MVLLLPAIEAALQSPSTSAVEAARAQIAKGQYKEAVAALEPVVAKSPENAAALELLMSARLETGDYRKAYDEGEAFLKRTTDATVAAKTAEAAMQIGEYERASAILEKVSTLRATWLKGLLADRNGNTEAAHTAFESVSAILSGQRLLSPQDRALAAAALVQLGRYKEANQAYHDAEKSDPKNAAIKTEWGELLAEKHNPADAADLFREALQLNSNYAPAMVGVADLASDRWEGQAVEGIRHALAVNPNLPEAHLLFARSAMEEDDFKTAEEHIEQLLKVNPRLLEAWSLRAVLEYLKAYQAGNNSPADQPAVAWILKENPHYGKVFADLGDFCFEKRQIAESVEFYRRALKLDDTLDESRSRLGINLFRLGNEEEARKVLEDAYARDPFNVWTVNTLRLMDSFSKFDTFETAHFSAKLQKKESAILRPYVEDLLEKTYSNLTRRYGFAPPVKTTFEMYPDHEDFAVRTLGLPGLGALGATIGNVVAMDSPSARPVGSFHWGSTLWHEAAHVISLGITAGRVPRWFTEGLSVYEETHAREGWGDPMEMETIAALQEKKLLPLAELNAAFVRPKFPGQIQFAYYQGGMICEFIATKYGFPKILAMLQSYAKGRSDAEAIQDATGLAVGDFDAAFLEYVRKETYGFGEALDLKFAGSQHKPEELRAEAEKNPHNFFARLFYAQQLAKDSKWDQAEREAQAAQELFPPYVGRSSPYKILADAYEAQGKKEKAAAELENWVKQKGRAPEGFKKLAQLLHELGRTGEAIATLEEAMNVDMFDLENHQQLGEWYLATSHPDKAVREYRAALELHPSDAAGAHYHLAAAYNALSDTQRARQEVLESLEIAPGFRPAQKLLLELSGERTGN